YPALEPNVAVTVLDPAAIFAAKQMASDWLFIESYRVLATVYVLPRESEQVTLVFRSQEIATTIRLPAVFEALNASDIVVAAALFVFEALCTYTIGIVVLLTLRGIGELVAEWPAVSRATAVKMCPPFVAVRVFHDRV